MLPCLPLGLTLLLGLTLAVVTSGVGSGLSLTGLPLGLWLALALGLSETEVGLAGGLPLAGLPLAVP